MALSICFLMMLMVLCVCYHELLMLASTSAEIYVADNKWIQFMNLFFTLYVVYFLV